MHPQASLNEVAALGCTYGRGQSAVGGAGSGLPRSGLEAMVAGEPRGSLTEAPITPAPITIIFVTGVSSTFKYVRVEKRVAEFPGGVMRAGQVTKHRQFRIERREFGRARMDDLSPVRPPAEWPQHRFDLGG